MNMKKITVILLLAALLASATACAGENSDGDDTLVRETFEKETYVTVSDGGVTLTDGLALAAYGADTPAGAWLAGCSNPDRDDQFDAYVLRHESTADGNTTFTYLIYYPHGGTPLVATPELLEGETGYVVNLRYAAGGRGDYALSRLEVTLPTQSAPRLRLLLEEEALGVLSTVTDSPIS